MPPIITRRAALLGLLGAGCGTPPRTSLDHQGAIATITRPEGTFAVWYGNHLQKMDGTLLPAAAKGVVLENNVDYLSLRFDGALPASLFANSWGGRQHAEVQHAIERRRLPIFLMDLFSSDEQMGLWRSGTSLIKDPCIVRSRLRPVLHWADQNNSHGACYSAA